MSYRTFIILVASLPIVITILLIGYSCLVISSRSSREEERRREINSHNPDSKPNQNEVDLDNESD